MSAPLQTLSPWEPPVPSRPARRWDPWSHALGVLLGDVYKFRTQAAAVSVRAIAVQHGVMALDRRISALEAEQAERSKQLDEALARLHALAPHKVEPPSASFLRECAEEARRSIGACDVAWSEEGNVQIAADSSPELLAHFDEFIDRWWLDNAPRELDVVLVRR